MDKNFVLKIAPIFMIFAFIVGFLNSSAAMLLSWLSVGAFFLIGLVMVVRSARGKGLKGVMIALLLIIVLIPVSVFGGCGLTAFGMQLRGMFFR